MLMFNYYIEVSGSTIGVNVGFKKVSPLS